MSAHRLYRDLNKARMPTSGQTHWTPNGFLKGWGTTVGNGIQGWAPSALFQDTDASQGSQVFVNTGTKTTATWTEIADAGVAGGFTMTGTQDISGAGKITLEDAVEIIFGTGDDVQIAWDGTSLNLAPPTGMWANCPLVNYANGHTIAHEFFDDFHRFSHGAVDAQWTLTNTSGTAVLGSAETSNTPGLGGFVAVAAGATDNNFAQIRLTTTNTGAAFLVAGKAMWFEARFMVDGVADNSFYVGLCDEATTEAGADGTGAENFSADGIYWRTLNATPTELDFAHTQNGNEAEVQGNSATLGADTIVTVGFYSDGTTLTPYVNGTAKTTVLIAATNFPDDQGLTPFIFVKQGASAAATIFVDYIKCVQLR